MGSIVAIFHDKDEECNLRAVLKTSECQAGSVNVVSFTGGRRKAPLSLTSYLAWRIQLQVTSTKKIVIFQVQLQSVPRKPVAIMSLQIPHREKTNSSHASTKAVILVS